MLFTKIYKKIIVFTNKVVCLLVTKDRISYIDSGQLQIQRGESARIKWRPANKFTIVPPVNRPGIVWLSATDGIYASPRRCGSRSTREVHNIMTEWSRAYIKVR